MMMLYKGEGAKRNGHTWSVDGFKPSTDIAAALQVLERATDHGEPCEIEYHLVGTERFASVTLNTCPEWRGISMSGLPHAISLAVLKKGGWMGDGDTESQRGAQGLD